MQQLVAASSDFDGACVECSDKDTRAAFPGLWGHFRARLTGASRPLNAPL